MLGHPWTRTVLWAVGYVVAGIVGRLTIVDDEALSLVWPAAGVALLWMLLQGVGPRSWDAVALALATVVVNVSTGAGAGSVAVFVVANLVQVFTIAALLRRHAPHLLGCGGDLPLARNRDLARFVGASAVGTAAGAALGALGLALVAGGVTAEGALVWWGRNLCGVLLVGATGLLTAHRWRVGASAPPPGRWRPVEGVALVTWTALLYTVAFGFDLPLAFPLLVTTVWAGLRFSTLVVSWHSLACAAAGIAFTLAGYGPFAQVDDPESTAVLAQLFIGLIAMTGLAVAVGRDERVRLARHLRTAEQQATGQMLLLTTILESMTDGVTVVDDTGEVLLQNPAALRLFGLQEVERLDLLVSRVTHLDGRPLAHGERPAVRVLRGETVRDVDLLVARPDGTERVLRVSGTPLPPTSPEDRTRAVLSFHDVTHDLEKAEELQQFARVVAHDIRNPIAAIDGWNTMIRRRQATDELTPELLDRFTGRLGTAVQRLNGLIDGLLDHATSRDRTLALTRIDLGPLLHRIVESRGAERLVTWGVLPAVHADTLLVSQLLDNLVGNALKYVEPGKDAEVRVVAEERRPGWATISVADRGIGIPEAQLESVFDEFQRADPERFDGTGLGLSIARRVVTRHGGTIRAYANPDGPGTTFEFSLPLEPEESRADERPAGSRRS